MSEPALRISDLTKDFGGLRAVDSISFEISQGELVGLNRTKWVWENNDIQLHIWNAASKFGQN